MLSIVNNVASAIRNLPSTQTDPINLSEKSEKVTRIPERNINDPEKTEYDPDREIISVMTDQKLNEPNHKQLRSPGELDWSVPLAVQGYGSITGSLIQLGVYSHKPAIQVKEFSTGQSIWCQVNESVLSDVGKMICAKHVWDGQEVRVTGMINFDDTGKMTHLFDSKISFFYRRQVSLEELHDPGFSEGLPSEEYLERLRND